MAEDRSSPAAPAPIDIDTSIPHSARIWNYWMGGKDNYEADRAAGDAYMEKFPEIASMARQSRQFLIQAVRYLTTEAGIRQFLDIGTGLPTMENTHEVAQGVAPESRVVYVDNDPMVLAHARALLSNTTPEGVTTYIDADVRAPEVIVADAKNVLNFTKPIAVIFMGIMGHIADFDEARSIVARVMAAVPSGSYLVLGDGTNSSEGFEKAQQGYDDTGAVPYTLRSPGEIAQFFEGLDILEPGVVSPSLSRPGPTDLGTPQAVHGYRAVGRKP